MTAQLDPRQPTVDHFRLGLTFAVASAFAFGMSGPLAKSLMEAGWSPTAAVTARLAGGALAMIVFATVMKRDWLRNAVAHWKTVLAYGSAGCRCTILLLQRRLASIRWRRAPARIHRTGARRGLAVGDHPPAART